MAQSTTVLTTLALASDGSTATLDLKLRGDGSYSFTDSDSEEQTVHSSDFVRRLFEELEALV